MSEFLQELEDFKNDKDYPVVSTYESKELNFNLNVFGTFENPMFLLRDVGKLLGIKNHRDFAATLPNIWKSSVEVFDGIGRKQQMILINEFALYRFIMRSHKEEAIKFQNWLCCEVIPNLRKYGTYKLEAQVKALTTENESLQIEYGDLLTKDRTDLRIITEKHKNVIPISRRLIDHFELFDGVELNVDGQEFYDNIMNTKYISINEVGDYILPFTHPHKSRFVNRLGQISKRMSLHLKTNHRDVYMYGAPIGKNKRNNMYSLNDYTDLGLDKIIQQFLIEFPFKSWKVEYIPNIEMFDQKYPPLCVSIISDDDETCDDEIDDEKK